MEESAVDRLPVCQISDGEVTTLAGVCDQPGHTDGVGENARFSELYGLAAGGPDGSIVVSDSENHCIRRIAPDGTTSTLAGAWAHVVFRGQGAAAKFNEPDGVAVDGEGSAYVADYNNHRIRKITPSGVVTTFAGSGTEGSIDGPGANASFNFPRGLAVDGDGNLIVADRTCRTKHMQNPSASTGSETQGPMQNPSASTGSHP